MSFGDRLQHAWNAFIGRDPTSSGYVDLGPSSTSRPDHSFIFRGNDHSIVDSIYNRIAVDAAAVNIRHIRVNDEDQYVEDVKKSSLNEIFKVSANTDQSGRDFIKDIVLSMFDEGVVAVVPIETKISRSTGSISYTDMRTGRIKEWYPHHVRVNVYNERTGHHEDVILPKSGVAIIENPFYSSMNRPNSTLQRLIRTLNHIDKVNDMNSSGKLDLIVQIPYGLKTKGREQQANERRASIERQLVDSKLGIAYMDTTERITQLNRPLDNSLWTQAKDLKEELYSQLGLAPTVFDGTADEKTMLNYYNRSIKPVLAAITEEFIRKFLTKTARSQGQTIRYFRDPFELMPITDFAEVATKLTQAEIATSNEMRSPLGWKPSDSQRANELLNKNINTAEEANEADAEEPQTEPAIDGEEINTNQEEIKSKWE